MGTPKGGGVRRRGRSKKSDTNMKLYIPQFGWGGSIWKSLKERGGEREGEEEAKRAFGEYLGHSVRRVTSKNVLKI